MPSEIGWSVTEHVTPSKVYTIVTAIKLIHEANEELAFILERTLLRSLLLAISEARCPQPRVCSKIALNIL